MTKEKAINKLNYIKESFAQCELSYEALDMAIKALEERKVGSWITTFEVEDAEYVRCDRCKTKQVLYYGKAHPNFCPQCGARMLNGR